MKKAILGGMILGLAVLIQAPVIAHAADSVVTKAEDGVGDMKTDAKKTGRDIKRKATGKDDLGHKAVDKVKDAGDDMSNSADKAKRKAE